MNQSEFLAIPFNLLKGREKSRLQSAMVFGLLLIGWKTGAEIFKPITVKRRNRVLTFDSHLKIALTPTNWFFT